MNQKKAPCTVVLIAVNTAVFLALSVIGMTEDAGFMLQHGATMVNIMNCLPVCFCILDSSI